MTPRIYAHQYSRAEIEALTTGNEAELAKLDWLALQARGYVVVYKDIYSTHYLFRPETAHHVAYWRGEMSVPFLLTRPEVCVSRDPGAAMRMLAELSSKYSIIVTTGVYETWVKFVNHEVVAVNIDGPPLKALCRAIAVVAALVAREQQLAAHKAKKGREA